MAGADATGDRVESAAILCGGRARRMGADKATLRLAGIPLVERVWRHVRDQAGVVVAVGGTPRVEHLGIELVPDRYPGANSMGGIATALGWVGERFGDAWMLIVACDMPFIEPRLLRGLAAVRDDHDVVVPRLAVGYEPLCALYRTGCLSALEDQIRRGRLRMRDLFERVRTREVVEAELRRCDPDLRSFINLNRPEDLERAQALLAAGGMTHGVEPGAAD